MITNQQIKFIRSLHQKKNRDQNRLYLAEGLNIVREALQFMPDAVEMLLYTTKSLPHIQSSLKNIAGTCIPVPARDFSRISTQKSPQELLAVLKMKPDEPLHTLKNELILALDSIRDPGNLGTLIRLADWFGVKQLVCSEDTVDCYNPKVVQSSMGALFRVSLCYTSLSGYIRTIREKQPVQIYGTSLGGKNLYETLFSAPGVIILGNEAKGMSKDLLQLADENILIPNYSASPDKTESLNVAVAGAILCAEFRRQTG